ncbi:CaiB/BaiF CoA transferase family protein [Rhodococcus sp. IEGM1428]|uniref:CaiB/BaiF CoA transferase family protein n=1 Tax=Rhodococcus sp. IEGM1428 TaxID=3392191 RepID=UPI003D09BD70
MDSLLGGIRILDLSRLVAGNQLTMMLGDFGADVIKVEQAGVGDSLRRWQVEEVEVHWKVYGRNKRSIELDLKRDLDLTLLLRLVETADVLVESFKPGDLERFGLSPEVLRGRNQALVVTRISGWGQTGSHSKRPGFGTLVEAMSGFAAMNGFADRPPVLPPGALADMIAGIYGAFATVAAVRKAEQTGEGQDIDLSLFEPLFSTLGPQALNYALTGLVPERSGSRMNISAPRNVYECSDGKWLAMSGSTQPMAEQFFRVMDRSDLVTDPRFVTNAARVANMDALDAIVGEYFARSTLAENLGVMESAGITAAPVYDISDLVRSEYFRTRRVLIDGPDADDPDRVIPMHDVVPRLSGTPGSVARPAPRLGEHTEEILRSIAIDDEWDEFAAHIDG